MFLSLLLVSAAVSLCPISHRGFRPMQLKSASLTGRCGDVQAETEIHFLEALHRVRSVELSGGLVWRLKALLGRDAASNLRPTYEFKDSIKIFSYYF